MHAAINAAADANAAHSIYTLSTHYLHTICDYCSLPPQNVRFECVYFLMKFLPYPWCCPNPIPVPYVSSYSSTTPSVALNMLLTLTPW